MRRLSCLLAVLVVFAATAHAQTSLRWKLNERFYAEVTTSQQQSMKIQGKAADAHTEYTLLLIVQPQAKAPNGTRIIDLTIDSVKFTTPGKTKAPEEAVFKILEGAELKVTLGADFQVQKVDGLAETVKKLGGGAGATLPQPVRDTMQSTFEGMLGFLASELFVPLPEKTVQKGGQWEQKSALRVPLVGTLSLQKELTYEGKGRLPYQNFERVSAKGKFTYAPSKEGGDLLGVKILKADVKVSEYKGTLHFDPVAGRLAHAEVKMKTDVAVQMVVNKQKTQTQGVQEETLTIQTFDKKPAGK